MAKMITHALGLVLGTKPIARLNIWGAGRSKKTQHMKGGNTMARVQNIRFQMKAALNAQEYYGHSKHDDQVRTYQERQQLKNQGATREEYMSVDYTADHIYSFGTMRVYQYEVNRFADYLADNGFKKCTMDEAKEHIQEYLDYQRDRGLSAYSVHTTCAALCKTFHLKMQDFTIPQRRLADITRSREERQHDKINEERAGEALKANRVLALRRKELEKLRVSSFRDRGNEIQMDTIGKGGKHNTTIFRNEQEISLIRELINGKEPNDYVFDRQLFANDADFHQTRAEAFQTRYQRYVEDMQKHPEKREEYQRIVRDTFAARGKELKEDLDKPYYCRGSHRQQLLKQGLSISYDRTAVMLVSLESHFRSGVLVAHYLAK